MPLILQCQYVLCRQGFDGSAPGVEFAFEILIFAPFDGPDFWKDKPDTGMRLLEFVEQRLVMVLPEIVGHAFLQDDGAPGQIVSVAIEIDDRAEIALDIDHVAGL